MQIYDLQRMMSNCEGEAFDIMDYWVELQNTSDLSAEPPHIFTRSRAERHLYDAYDREVQIFHHHIQDKQFGA